MVCFFLYERRERERKRKKRETYLETCGPIVLMNIILISVCGTCAAGFVLVGVGVAWWLAAVVVGVGVLGGSDLRKKRSK